HVELLTVPSRDEYTALVRAAQLLKASRIVAGTSPYATPDEEARNIGHAWEQLPPPRPFLTLEIVGSDGGPPQFFSLGPHQPQLWPSDVDLVHRLWKELSNLPEFGTRLHHRDVVGVALRRLEQDLRARREREVLHDVEQELRREPGPKSEPPDTNGPAPIPPDRNV
ncbi:MAG: APC family permease, partial [Bryobacteraceae bacterium]